MEEVAVEFSLVVAMVGLVCGYGLECSRSEKCSMYGLKCSSPATAIADSVWVLGLLSWKCCCHDANCCQLQSSFVLLPIACSFPRKESAVAVCVGSYIRECLWLFQHDQLVEKSKQDDALLDLSNILGDLKSMAVGMGTELESNPSGALQSDRHPAALQSDGRPGARYWLQQLAQHVKYSPILDCQLEALAAVLDNVISYGIHTHSYPFYIYVLSRYFDANSKAPVLESEVANSSGSEQYETQNTSLSWINMNFRLSQLQHELPSNEPSALMHLVEDASVEDTDD
ncbi:hypothetical protein U1Q18_007864 [Sarracenia purpurea var. burkii]